MHSHAQGSAATSVTSVSDCDDLLREVLLRISLPHLLVRAALVFERWLLQASYIVFLNCFHDHHPPCLLGFCGNYSLCTYEFVPLPQPPKLTAFSHCAVSSCNDTFVAHPRDQLVNHTHNRCLVNELAHLGTSEQIILKLMLAKEYKLHLPPMPSHVSIFLPGDWSHDGITLVHFIDMGREADSKYACWDPGDGVTQIEPTYTGRQRG
jgi:hypothetical protein